MGLKIKSFQEIMRGMVDWVAQGTNRLIDFSVGSVIRTFLEAVASEIEEFYYKTYKNFIWAVENSIYQSFGFEKIPAMKAYGILRLTFTGPLINDYVLPAGSQFSTYSNNPDEIIYFETQQDYTFPAGSTYADITVYCTEPGEIGNVASYTITQMVNAISFVSTVYNPDSFNTGRNEETQAERKVRFSRYIDTRHRGTKKALEYAALEIPEITGVYVDDPGTGMVYLYCHDANGDLPETLRNRVIKNLENYRPAGIPVFVQPIVKNELDVSLEIHVLPSFNNETFREYLRVKIEDFLDDFVVGQDFIESDLNAFIRGLDEVAIKNCIVKSPVGDVSIGVNELVRSGMIDITLVSVEEV